MPTPRVAAIHDMSGFGRCSLTVAIPVLSAMGVQCCPLPTAYLSTHTGGFTGYTFLDMTDELPKTAAHWAELGIHFDAVYTGFMGSEAQMDLAADFVRTFRRDRSTIFICDPVMGDHGKIYKTYTPAMCAGMTRLAELADVIVPNLTEAAVLLGEDHSFGALTHDEAGYRSVVERLSRNGTRSVVLTGVMLRKGEIGACVFDRTSGGTEFLFDTFIGKEFHGTGDVFASVLTGALVKGKTLHEAVRLAEAFVRECAIQTMPQNIPAREGVDFEPILWKLHEGLSKRKRKGCFPGNILSAFLRVRSAGLERGDGVGEPVALEFLDAALVREGGELGINGHLGEQRDAVLFRGLGAPTLAKEVNFSAAVGTDEIAHVLHKADDGNRHLHRLFHHHADKLLRGGNDHDAGERDGLKDAQRHVAGARRHIDEEVVDVPENVGPELGDHAADDGAAPDDGIGLIVEQKVDGHDLDAGRADAGQEGIFRADGLLVHPKRLRDGGAGDVGVQNADAIALAAQADGELARDHRLADAALAGHDAEHLADVRIGVGLFQKGLGTGALTAAFAAGRAVVGAFTHGAARSFAVGLGLVYTEWRGKSTARVLTSCRGGGCKRS